MERISARELFEWAAFEQTFGPITVQERTDHAAALEAWVAARAAGSEEAEVADFLPVWDVKEQEARKPKQTPEQMIAVIRGLQAGRKKKRKESGEQPRSQHPGQGEG
jgi:hypothetical protein